MSKRQFNITDAKRGAAIPIRVTSRAAQTEILGIKGEGSVLHVRLMASSAGTQEANEELVNLLSEFLEMPQDKIEIVAGATGREKIVSIEDISVSDIQVRLESA